MTNKARIVYLKHLFFKLDGEDLGGKIAILNKNSYVQSYFKRCLDLALIKAEKDQYLLKCLIAIGEYEIVLNAIRNNKIKNLLLDLKQVEAFFSKIGGIVGYQLKVLSLLNKNIESNSKASFHLPFFIDISKDVKMVKRYIKNSIEMLDQMAEIYVVGGAADRLHLLDDKKRKRLPAATMSFFFKTLLRRLIEDVQAKEHLYEKIKGKKIVTPIALMCSKESDNYNLIKALINQENYFNRPKDSFFFLVQPSSPVIAENGRWLEDSPGKLLLKPSGHGALWKLAKDHKLFEWFFEKNRKKALVRQINNPIAGIDYSLMAFTGYGLENNSHFGFLSCPRQVNSAEGVNVLVEERIGNKFKYKLTNIEYCELEKFKIEDGSYSENKHSKFSSNTNVLFVDLKEIYKKVDQCPYPGMLVNFKSIKTKNSQEPIFAARLETTMQNIADVLNETKEIQLKHPYKLSKVFVTHNLRNKTISTTKRVYSPSKSYLETPEKCFYDFVLNSYDLLKNYCLMEIPKVLEFEKFILTTPPFLFSYHPAFGPLYKIIAQKLKKGFLKENSEMVLDIAEFFCENIQLEGSLRVFSTDLSARCFFKNVSITNAGINFDLTENYWKGAFKYNEKCDIYLGKESTLFADDIEILNNQTIVVPNFQSVEVLNIDGKMVLKEVKKKTNLIYRFLDDLSIEVVAEKKFLQPQI